VRAKHAPTRTLPVRPHPRAYARPGAHAPKRARRRAPKSEKAFDTDLRDDGVVALLVTVQNSNAQPLSVKGMDYVLRDGANTLKLLSPEEAAERAKKSAAGRAIGWSLIVPIIGIPFAATASVLHTNKVNRQMREDFSAKNLATMTVAQGKDSSGFQFFESEKGRGDFSNLSLEIKGTLEGAADPVVVVTPIAPVMVKVDPAATAGAHQNNPNSR